MRTRTYRIPANLGALLLLLTIPACEGAQLPQLVHEPTPLPRLPMSVALDFDETVRNSRIEADACGSTWEGHLGHALATSFIRTSQDSFSQVQTAPAPGSATQSPPDLGIRLLLEQARFEPKTLMGADDTYTARFNIQMQAVVTDPQGNPIGKTPLSYDERVNIWTPLLGGGSSSCETSQLEAAMENAADALARQMVASVARWAAGPPQGRAPAPGTAAAGVPPRGAPPGQLVMKATLLDENDNVILEAGEKIGVRVDVQNTGATPVPTSSVTLSGTTALIDAFSSVGTGAVAMGPIQPGESKSTIVWGRMPDEVEPGRGELVVSVIAGGVLTSQTLVAAIRPGGRAGARAERRSPPAGRGAAGQPAAPSGGGPAARHAVLVNIDRYRTPWTQTTTRRPSSFPHLVRALRTAGRLSRTEMLVLSGRAATRADWEEGLLRWLPSKTTPQSVVVVYVSTQGVADDTNGEIFLIPYEGSPGAPRRTLISLHALQGTLKRMNASVCLLLLDVSLADTDGKRLRLDWQGVINSSGRASTRLIQVVGSSPSVGLDSVLVRALNGEADQDADGQVTIGELLDHLQGSSNIYPSVPASAPERTIPLTG